MCCGDQLNPPPTADVGIFRIKLARACPVLLLLISRPRSYDEVGLDDREKNACRNFWDGRCGRLLWCTTSARWRGRDFCRSGRSSPCTEDCRSTPRNTGRRKHHTRGSDG